MFEAKETATISEYGNQYWIVEESSQQWPDKDGPTEKVALTGSLPLECSASEMGKLGLVSLDNFNSKRPTFKPWELKELRRQICSWVGAKSWPSLYKNSRYVWVARDSSEDRLRIIPVDNCVVEPNESPLMDHVIELKCSVGPEELGAQIIKAFKYATPHPERKS